MIGCPPALLQFQSSLILYFIQTRSKSTFVLWVRSGYLTRTTVQLVSLIAKSKLETQHRLMTGEMVCSLQKLIRHHKVNSDLYRPLYASATLAASWSSVKGHVMLINLLMLLPERSTLSFRVEALGLRPVMPMSTSSAISLY